MPTSSLDRNKDAIGELMRQCASALGHHRPWVDIDNGRDDQFFVKVKTSVGVICSIEIIHNGEDCFRIMKDKVCVASFSIPSPDAGSVIVEASKIFISEIPRRKPPKIVVRPSSYFSRFQR